MTAAVFKFSRAKSGSPDGTPEGLETILDRLLRTIREENEAIERRLPVDYRDFNLKKSQGLLELTRLLPAFRHAGAGAAGGKRLAELVDELKRNQNLLDIQLRAARRIANVVAKAIQDGQSDGTYSAQAWRYQDE